MLFLTYVFSFLFLFKGTHASGCNQRFFDQESFVCVCDENACDDFPRIEYPLRGTYKLITSSSDEFRFEETSGNFTDFSEGYAKIFINTSDTRQVMLGFGGAFTDATGINVAKLSPALQDVFARQYFSSSGLEYNLGRVPIAGCDFSTHPYSYDDFEGDVELTNFSLTFEDFNYKIPLIKAAEQLSEHDYHLIASPWSPPSWMKTNGMFNGTGKLIPEMQQPWANYFVRFFNSYQEEGVTFYGFTPQNEPYAGYTDWSFNSCHFTAEDEKVFIRDYLGPTIQAAGYDNLKLLIGDSNIEFYPQYIENILEDEECASFVDGIAAHWYFDDYFSAEVFTQLHEEFPDTFILYTEACTGLPDNNIELGSWERGEQYAADIIKNINNWSTGWIDWNMALDLIGGPNWAANYVDSPVIVNETSNEFYKQPMFYTLGHFSKFIPEGSIHIGSTINLLEPTGNSLDPIGNSMENIKNPLGDIDSSSFIHPDGYVISVVLNMNTDAKTVVLEDDLGNTIQHNLPPKSIQTFIYTNEIQR